MSEEQLPLTLEEVARRLRVNERTVLRLLDRKALRGYKVGRVWRIDQADLDDYIKRQKEAANEEDAA